MPFLGSEGVGPPIESLGRRTDVRFERTLPSAPTRSGATPPARAFDRLLRVGGSGIHLGSLGCPWGAPWSQAHSPTVFGGPESATRSVSAHDATLAVLRPYYIPTIVTGANVLANISVGSNPAYPCYDPSDGDIYVPTYGAVLLGGNNVSIISGATNQLIAMKSVGDDPISAVYDGGDHDVYVMNFGLSDNLTVLQGTNVIAWVGVGTAPIGGVYDPGNGYLYVSNFQSNNISVLSGTSVVASINVGMFPTTPTYDPTNGDIYVSNSGTNNVSIIQGTSVVATVQVGTNPTRERLIAGTPSHAYIPRIPGATM